MNTACLVALALVLEVSTPSERLIAARTKAYDANFHNDAAALQAAVVEFDQLANDPAVGRMALYYAAWTEWALAASQVQAGKTDEAIRTGERVVAFARRALQRDEHDPEVITMLVNGLIVVAVLDRPRLPSLAPEVARLRRRAIELAPANPRVVMMDAGMIFNNPPEYGGGREKGLARWLEAMELFEREERSPAADPLRPRWGRPLAYGWLADLYLRLEPPQQDKARDAANTALKMRPDFWYVNEQVLPKLAK